MAPPPDGAGDAQDQFPAPLETAKLRERFSLDSPSQDVGPYRLLSKIGQGGFGEVWVADRNDGLKQRVALKLIKPGWDSDSVVARFEQERQALAMMNHEGIAKIFDSGLSDQHRPFFVMEYVDGEPITEFCDRHSLGIRARLELFGQVCEAVHHAHTKGIVHRDLKPSNILAFMSGKDEGRRPRAKVIDFGIAKALHGPLTDKALLTGKDEMIGTPDYMSPEQADPGPGGVDTLSDVYSLGVVLYELLTGSRPFEDASFASKKMMEIRDILLKKDPPTPSTRLTSVSTKDPEKATQIEKTRGVVLKQLARDLRSELEWIPLMAMRKEPKERYQTALALREDIQRYLKNEPINAKPASIGYVAHKYFRRHRTLVILAAIVVISLGSGLGVALWQRSIALQQRAEARKTANREMEARKRAESVFEFLTSILQTSDPAHGGSRDVTVLESMRMGATRLSQSQLRGDPAAIAWIQIAIGQILMNAGDIDEASALVEPALRTLDELGASQDHYRAWGKMTAGALALEKGDTKSAEKFIREARALRERLGSPINLARTDTSLANVLALEGHLDEALQFAMSSVEVLKGSMNKVNRETVGDLADSMTNLADILLRRGENSEAEQVFKKVLELREKILGPKDQAVAQALINLGISIEIQGRVSEAVEGYSRALAIYREKFPGDHPKVAWALHSLVNGLMADGRPEEAWSLAEEAAAMLRRLSPGKPDHLARMLSVLAYIRFTDGRLGEAEKLFSELVEVLRDSATEDSIELAEGIYNLASVRRLLELNARSLAEEALAIYDRLKRNNPSERSNFQKLVEEYRHSDVNAMIRNGDQEGAAKELDGLIEINPGDHWKWYQIMALNAHLGRTNYLQHCSEVFHRFASTAAPEIAERIAKASMLLPPPPGSDWANKALELSARAVGLGTNSGFLPYYQTAHALALLRTGQWDACTTEARKALREPGVVPARDAQAGAVLGIAYRKLGKAEEARSAVKQAMTSMPEGFLESGALPSGAGDDWHDWLMARVLVREALAELSMDPP